jgi:PAS domain-containing protein
MREGMVLLSGAGDVLSINESAAEIFGVRPDAYAGRPSCRSTARWRWSGWWNGRSRGESAEAELKMGERVFQLIGNPVEPENGAGAR